MPKEWIFVNHGSSSGKSIVASVRGVRNDGCRVFIVRLAVALIICVMQALHGAALARANSVDGARERLTLISVPRAEVVTGGDVLLGASRTNLRFALADGTPLHVQRFSNPAGGSWYLLTGLPKGSLTVVARDNSGEFDRLPLHNTSKDGPVISGARETPFFCETDEFEIGPGLGKLPVSQPPTCTTGVRIDWLTRDADGRFQAVKNAANTQPAKQSALVRLETGVIDRSIYQIALPVDAATQVVAPGTRSRAWNGKVIYKFGGGCRGGWYEQGATTAGVLNATLLAAGYAVVSASLNVFGNDCNDLLASEVMMMVREHFIETYGPPRYVLGFGCSGGSYQGLQIADNYPGLLDGILIGCTLPEVILGTLTNLFDARLLEHYFANAAVPQAARARSGADPGAASKAPEIARAAWSDAQILAVTGYASIANLHKSAEGAARIDVTPRRGRKAAEFDDVVPKSARYRAIGHRHGARPTVFDHTVNVYGRDPKTGFARWPLDNRGVEYGLQAFHQHHITLAQFIDLNRRIGGMDREGNFIASRTLHDPEATRIAYSSGRILSARGGLSAIPIIDYRSWTDRNPRGDIHMAYHSRTLRARLQNVNHHLDNEVLLIEDDDCESCALFSLERPVLQFALERMDAWLMGIRAVTGASNGWWRNQGHSGGNIEYAARLAEVRRARPPNLVDACWIEGQQTPMPRVDEGPCAKRFPLYSFPRSVAGAPIANDIVACTLRPLNLTDYPDASPAALAELRKVFADGVCDWSKAGVAQVDYAGVWQSFGPVAIDDRIVKPQGSTSRR